MNKLYLIPSTLGDSPVENVLPCGIEKIINSIDYYIVENERTARRFLLKAGLLKPLELITFFVLDKHSPDRDTEKFLSPISEADMGVISEAGMPCIADPGAEIVKIAHLKGIRVIPLSGPSSILMTLMASGLNGQNFAFVGYLPVKHHERTGRIRQLEKRSLDEHQSQLFMEAPYRNNQLLNDILEICHPATQLCIGTDVSLGTEMIQTRTIGEWKKKKPDLHKRPAIFIIQRM